MELQTRFSGSLDETALKAYREVASYRWANAGAYQCADIHCRHKSYYEGRTPFSRRCAKCKREESITARTSLDKMRLGLPVIIELVRHISDCQRPPGSVDLKRHIEAKWNGVRVRQDTLWDFLSRISKAIAPIPPFFEDQVLFAWSLYRDDYPLIVAEGHVGRRPTIFAEVIESQSDKAILDTVDRLTSPTARVTLVRGDFYSDTRKVKVSSCIGVGAKPELHDKADASGFSKAALKLAAGLKIWLAGSRDIVGVESALNWYNFGINHGSYDELMTALLSIK